jgi:hypothetical protein
VATGERPYLQSIAFIPTEIKTTYDYNKRQSVNLTVAGRIRIILYDENDTDVGIDPYVTSRTSVQGTYWKKWVARNPYYKGRTVKVYEGFTVDGTGIKYLETEDSSLSTPLYILNELNEMILLDESDTTVTNVYQQKWVGIVDSISFQSDGTIEIEAVDMLKSITKIEVPVKRDIKLEVNMSTASTQFTVNQSSNLGSTGHIRINDEIISYSANDTTAHVLSGCTRGAFGTTPSCHNENTKAQECLYIAPTNPIDILYNLFTSQGGITTAYLNTTSFNTAKIWPRTDINYSAIITQPMKLDELCGELLDHLNCKAWVAEDLKITVKRCIPNMPGQSYTSISDAENIIYKSDKSDLNPDSRMSRCALYWDKNPIKDENDPQYYSRIDVAIDADSESSFEYNEIADKRIYSRWIQSTLDTEEIMNTYTRNLACRKVARNRDPQPLIDIAVEMKDSTIKTGEYIKLNSDVLLDIAGTSLSGVKCQVVRRQYKDNVIDLKLQKILDRRIAFIAVASAVSSAYSTATEASREYGYICGANLRMANDDPCYRIY